MANFLLKLAIGLVLLLVTVCDNLETADPKGARTVFANDIVCRAFVETVKPFSARLTDEKDYFGVILDII